MFMINLINRIATRKIVSLIFSIIFFSKNVCKTSVCVKGRFIKHEKEQPVEIPIALDFCGNLRVWYYSVSEKPCR